MTQNNSGFGFKSPLTKAVKEGLPDYEEQLESLKKLQGRPKLPSLTSQNQVDIRFLMCVKKSKAN
ncbi:MAG: hypothetical protein ACYST2_06950 [Planctomycetota bacterium]